MSEEPPKSLCQSKREEIENLIEQMNGASYDKNMIEKDNDATSKKLQNLQDRFEFYNFKFNQAQSDDDKSQLARNIQSLSTNIANTEQKHIQSNIALQGIDQFLESSKQSIHTLLEAVEKCRLQDNKQKV